MRACRAVGVLAAFGLAVALAGCNKEEAPENMAIPRLRAETRSAQYGSMTSEVMTLPVSGTRITVRNQPLVNEFEIVNVEMVEVELGSALLLQVSEKAARALYRQSVSNRGGRIVLTVNGNPVGARRVNRVIDDGNFYTFVEMPDEKLEELVIELRETVRYLQANKDK